MKEQLFFWHFFKAIELTLSYERWIDKYYLFINALMQGTIPVDHNFQSFRLFCRILYLQDSRDEKRFDELLDEAIRREGDMLYQHLITAWEASETATEKKTPPAPAPLPNLSQKGEEEGPDKKSSPKPRPQKKDEEVIVPQSKTMYYKTPLDFGEDESSIVNTETEDTRFLHTDEYFSLTRRNMVKGWQFLRYKERGQYSQEVDVPSTALKIAREGLFTEPVFLHGARNREDTLIILADVLGSMMPFHELTNRLIYTAQNEGGHGRAPVFYFQNFPVGYVYRKPNLASPVKLQEALQKANRNVTTAIVISDAGAARGNTESERVGLRREHTATFLRSLHEHCAKVLWLNPVPFHRWQGTAADSIDHVQMVSVFEQDMYNFQDTLRAVFKQKA